MRVLVDTSVWADFFNDHPSRERAALSELLRSDHDACTCGVIVAEVFQGLRRQRGRAAIERSFRDMILLEAEGIETYLRAAALFRELRSRGHTIRSTIDCLIAVLADEGGCALLARDRDLSAILESGLVDVRSWPAS